MRHRDDAGPVAQLGLEAVHRKGAVFLQHEGADAGAGLLGHHLPGNDVGVVLGDADQDLVAGLKPRLGPAAGNQVERHGGAGGQNDLVARLGANEAGNLATHRLIQVGRRLGQEMQPAMHIGVCVLIGRHQRVENLLRLLRRCRAVEINKRLAVHLAGQDRKIRPDGVKIEFAADAVHHDPSPPASHASATGRRSSAKASFSIVSMVSIRNASISIARAVS